MRRLEIKEAAHNAVALISPKFASNGVEGNGLGSKNKGGRFARPEHRIAGLRDVLTDGAFCVADGSGWRRFSANISMPLRSKRCGGRSPQILRRMTAAPCLDLVEVFLFGGVRTHGLIAPALYRFCGLMPCGEPLRSPFPKLRYFLHPHGVALPVGRLGGFEQFNLGACHE